LKHYHCPDIHRQDGKGFKPGSESEDLPEFTAEHRVFSVNQAFGIKAVYDAFDGSNISLFL